MKIVDFHCDALSKLWEDSKLSFEQSTELDVTLQSMNKGKVGLQVFAIFLSEQYGRASFERVMAQIDIFRSRLIHTGHLEWLKWSNQVEDVRNGEKRWGLISLEGMDGLEGNLHYVRLCYELGVRFMGLTWNHANWAADGVMEKRGGGLTNQGRSAIQLCNELGILLDVSHLSVAGFWELAELTTKPLIASHSNVFEVCPHPRNLNDEQIRAIIAMDGRIGLTFVPWFIKRDTHPVKPEDLLPHIERICTLGGAEHLMFGSDFDGIDEWVEGLENPGRYQAFTEMLLKYYPEQLVRGWMSGNALDFLGEHLPEQPDKQKI
ncbi:dipeptidase [Paenibacillus dakarensis]|uniref:dipeptidase n=1 Tax=Paenibacillus dakarensis TaxID=1527293 RepID=UPI000A6581AE|nr:dipeptidase [Paenibacillus dakarensis]